jgi:hypothetical protein
MDTFMVELVQGAPIVGLNDFFYQPDTNMKREKPRKFSTRPSSRRSVERRIM